SMSRARLHPLLRYSHLRRWGCRVIWDLRRSPSAAILYHKPPYPPIPPDNLRRYATIHAVRRMNIRCNFFPYPWIIYADNPNGVRIVDVFRAIKDALEVPLTRAEWQGLSHKQREGAYRASDERRRSYPISRRLGIKRVDCLQLHTRFAGLSMSWDAPNTWYMTLARPR
ncbi:hypothetical protein NEOLEDRAFT_1042254, partial [Neolentinus lepideus HHB14362 ss-1]